MCACRDDRYLGLSHSTGGFTLSFEATELQLLGDACVELEWCASCPSTLTPALTPALALAATAPQYPEAIEIISRDGQAQKRRGEEL